MQDGFDFFEGGGVAPPLGVNKCSAHDEPAGGRTSLLAGEKFPSGPFRLAAGPPGGAEGNFITFWKNPSLFDLVLTLENFLFTFLLEYNF